jgi:hypothetical protein
MSEHSPLIATRWETPFEGVKGDQLHLLRVDYPSTDLLQLADGKQFDFAEFSGPRSCEIWLFSEIDQTVYKVCADVRSIRIADECEFPPPSEWNCMPFAKSWRLTGSDMQRSVSSLMFGNRPSYVIVTGNDCIEFLATNAPTICTVARVHASVDQKRD